MFLLETLCSRSHLTLGRESKGTYFFLPMRAHSSAPLLEKEAGTYGFGIGEINT